MEGTLHSYLPGKQGDCRGRIQDLLRERKMSQAELAKRAGMSESAMSRYISGQTDNLSAENIVAIAKVFGVTTDFLLCLSDIPYTTNYDIERLGLSAKAAEKLLKRKVDPQIVSRLIESPPFSVLTEQLGKLRSDEFATAQGYLTELLGGAKALFSSHVRKKPGDRDAAQKALNDVRLLKATPRQLQTDALHDTLDQIIAEFKRSDDGQTEPSQNLTSEMTQKIVSDLKEQLGDSKSLHDVTPEMMTDAVTHALAPLNLPEKVEKRLRVLMLSMFTKPGDLAKPEEPPQTDEE